MKISTFLALLISLNINSINNPKNDSLIVTDCLIYNKYKTKIWINTDSDIGKIYYNIWTNTKYKKVKVFKVKQEYFNKIKYSNNCIYLHKNL